MNYPEAEKFILDKLSKDLPDNLYYHGVHHTIDVCRAAERLGKLEKISAEEMLLLKTAALFHDAGFIFQYYDNEPSGARIACDTLPSFGYSGVQITAISKLILATSIPHRPKNFLEKIICDADLDYLGRDDFYSISYTLRRELAEYGKVKTLLQWYEEQLIFLTKHTYFTEAANKNRKPLKQQYIDEIREMLGKKKTPGSNGRNAGIAPIQKLSTDEKFITLKSLSVFSNTTDEVIKKIASSIKTQFVKSGETIICKGEVGQSMYIVHRGRVKVHDDIYTIAELGEGKFFGEISLLDSEPRSASVTAVTDTTLFCIEQDNFYNILQKHRDVAQGIMRILIGRFRKQNATIINALKEKEKRLMLLVDQRTHQLQQAKDELEKAFHEIEEKNEKLEIAYKDIRDSINYAKRIQEAILPSVHNIYRALTNSFIYYKPKDIVSGDFYFFAEKKKQIIIGVADCTGHGVPGALMSMIGHDLLNQIVGEKAITSPSDILYNLEAGVRSTLKQDAEHSETKDGMDIALVSLSLHTSSEKFGEHGAENSSLISPDLKLPIKLEFTGAFRNLYIVRKDGNEVEEVKGDRHAIGGLLFENPKKFTLHKLQLHKGDTFYLTSDGYCDQFGGKEGKKFMSRNFQKLLISMRDMEINEQEAMIDKVFSEWKGEREQVDDVLVIGVRV